MNSSDQFKSTSEALLFHIDHWVFTKTCTVSQLPNDTTPLWPVFFFSQSPSPKESFQLYAGRTVLVQNGQFSHQVQ